MKNKTKKIIKTFIKDFKNNIKDLKSTKTFYKQIPNLLTTVRLLALIPFNILYFSGKLEAACIVIAIAFFTDSLDGKIARKYNLVTNFGAALDAISDKCMAIGVIIPACQNSKGLLINLLLEIIIAATSVIANLAGVKTKASMIGKIKTWPLFITITLSYISLFKNIPSFIITLMITITVIIQVFTALDYVKYNLSVYQEINK